jgi:hypothetical protein
MLDLDHPMTTHIFAAARAEDYLIVRLKHMTLTSTEERQRLLPDCQEALGSMRRLNNEYFGASAFIADAIEELQASLDELAALGTDPHSGNAYAINLCPACGTPLTRIHLAYMPKPEQRWSVFCSPCLVGFRPALRRLESIQGFGTCFI